MRALLAIAAAGLAASFVPASPAAADAQPFVGIPSPTVHGGVGNGFRHDRRRHRGFDGAILYYDREYQGDTAWRSNSFNDWWHDRRDRAYPAWVKRNRDCQRPWFRGDTLTC